MSLMHKYFPGYTVCDHTDFLAIPHVQKAPFINTILLGGGGGILQQQIVFNLIEME